MPRIEYYLNSITYNCIIIVRSSARTVCAAARGRYPEFGGIPMMIIVLLSARTVCAAARGRYPECGGVPM